MNPALPLNHFVPDSEARQFDDGRVYVYGSYDLSGDSFYCSREYHVFSSEDLVTWTHHGRSFTTEDATIATDWREAILFAPDCIYHDGAYRLFFCTAGNGEGVASSPAPAGPYSGPTPIAGAHGDAIDPAIFRDDDGGLYYYWGQFHARGARLHHDLSGIDESTLQTSLINEADHGFHEGASVRKRNGLYYLVYADISRGRPTALGYATAEHPLGPFTKRGIIIDNAGCDPETWNNHGSIAEVNGSWYVFYHRSSQGSRYNRRLCIEPISFNADGTIDEVEMTTGGVSGDLDPEVEMDASRACLLEGAACAAPLDPACFGSGAEALTHVSFDDAACYRYYAFSGQRRFSVSAASGTYGGTIELRLDTHDGEVIGSCRVERTGGWSSFEEFSCEIKPIEGRRALWLRFRSNDSRPEGRLFDVRSFRFS